VIRRSGMKLLHTFRSSVRNMTATEDGRLIVVLFNAKSYISNKKHTRWHLIKPCCSR
jgi:hypothetical protein